MRTMWFGQNEKLQTVEFPLDTRFEESLLVVRFLRRYFPVICMTFNVAPVNLLHKPQKLHVLELRPA